MIRLLLAAAADVPLPPEGRAWFFIDSANGQPSYKNHAGVVTTLQGSPGEGFDLPDGGDIGQVLAIGVSGFEWADQASDSGPAGTWANMLPPTGQCYSPNGEDLLPDAIVRGSLVNGAT